MSRAARPAKDDPVDAVERAVEQLFRLNSSRKVQARRSAAAGVVISSPGFVLLRRIHEEGPLSLGELSRLTEMDPAATGRQVHQLELDGLVVRSPSHDDGRVTVVRATPKGQGVRRRISEVGHRHMEDVLESWSVTDRIALGGLLTRLVGDLRTVHYRAIVDEQAG
jgi:DNA-binding MarR family transcriptional regulator